MPPTQGRACPACECLEFRAVLRGTDRLYRCTGREFQVVACRRCGLLQLHPRPEPAELRRYYPPAYWFAPETSAASRLEEAWRRLAARDHVRFVRRALASVGDAGPLLDVGCGGGLLVRMLRERGCPALGLDAALEAARLAWRRQAAPVVCGELSRAPFPPARFAAITMFHVLEHVPDPRDYLGAARELLQPGGRLIVQTPDAACWEFALLGRRWSVLDIPRHLTTFRGCDLERLVASCGFNVVRRKHFSLRDNPAGLATSLAPGLDPMARRVRGLGEGGLTRLAKDLLYFILVVAALPLTLAEGACGAGSTIMLEARKL